jgi:hypothetical protein
MSGKKWLGAAWTLAWAVAMAASASPGNSPLKHVLSHRPLAGFQTSAGGASDAAFAIELHHHSHVSPVHHHH